MKNYLDKKMYKEYEFLYKIDNLVNHGIIDLLIEDDDKYIIIDYKLKNISDSLYDKQLNGYREYITNKTGKKCLCYLYSIIDEKYRERQRSKERENGSPAEREPPGGACGKSGAFTG